MNPQTVTTPSWAGVDPTASAGFMAGFGIVEIAFAVVFTFLVTFVVLRKLLSTAGF